LNLNGEGGNTTSVTQTYNPGGFGGSSFYGGGGKGGYLTAVGTSAGVTPTAYGAGGGGGSNINTVGTGAGGSGGTGSIWIIEYGS
jgi:hypothetical protein